MRDLIGILFERKIPFTYSESPEKHEGDNWRREIDLALAMHFQAIRRHMPSGILCILSNTARRVALSQRP